MDLACTRCDLCATRTQVVVGKGDAHARVMLIGEAPGKNEDLGGAPFIGAAGHVLDEFLEAAGLVRDEIYITNVVKCRPPKNRNPLPEEIDACHDNLMEQIASIRPDIIVALGTFASRQMVGIDAPITAMQEQIYKRSIAGVACVVLPVYHPAATIYNRSLKGVFMQSALTLKELMKDPLQE